MDALKLSKSEILSTKVFVDLFAGTDDENKKTYRLLLKKWHPDMNDGDTSDVFVHINDIYNNKAASSVIEQSVEINGKFYPYDYALKKGFYDIYYTNEGRGFLINFTKNADKFKSNYSSIMTKLTNGLSGHRFADRYKDLLSCKLYENNGYYKVVVPQDYVPLNKLIDYIVDMRNWKMSAYIISRLIDQTLMYQHFGLSPIGCDPDFIFVNTKTHKIIDLSALFFSTEEGAKMIGLTSFQANSVVTKDIKMKVISDVSINSLVRNIALFLSGDLKTIGNINLIDKDTIHKELFELNVQMDTSTNMVKIYEKWMTKDILNIFKERSFFKNEVSFADLRKYL